MKNYEGKVSVITGAASGIGRAIADRCAKSGMQIVLADIEEPALCQAEKEIRATGASVLAVKTDVASAESVSQLAEKTIEKFGAVHMLFNNAGVAGDLSIWESSIEDWNWILGVNLWGVIHGIRAFLPLMKAQDTECYIVNTASVAGLISSPGLGIYKVAKHGVVTLSETLHHELVLQNSKIRVSVLCPGAVNTRILTCDRNRPNPISEEEMANKVDSETKESFRQSMSSEQVADIVFEALEKGKFYILTHPEYKEEIRLRMEDILEDRTPSQVTNIIK